MTTVTQQTLGALALVSPAMQGQELAIDSSTLDIVFDAPSDVVYVDASFNDQRVSSSSYVVNGTKNRFTISLTDLVPSMIAIQVLVVGRDYNPSDDPATGHTTPTYVFNLIYTPVSTALPTIAPPSGVKSYKGLNTAKVEWVVPVVEGFLGVRVQYSTDSTGINIPYKQFGQLVTTISRTENSQVTLSSTKSVNENITTYTDVETTVLTNYSSVVFPKAVAGGSDVFYVVLSTVVQDPQTNHVYESSYNGPYQCGFVDLRQVGPADFLYLQQKEDIATRLIVSATRNYPDLDLTPRSEIRDLHIDPISLELSNQSVREWFARCSESISAMAQLDDYNGDGFSDDITESPFKNQIARAWNMSSQDVQFLIDKQFDILGESRAGLTRGTATTAVAMVTLYTYAKPTSVVTLQNVIVASTGDGNTVPSLNFYARGTATVSPQSADSIYDPVNGWWAITLPFECGTTGTIGNVGSGTITQNVSGLPTGWFCVNLDPAQYGTDRESNAKFAERIKNRMVVGIDSGRRLGYLETARSTPGVVDAKVVSSGDLMMLRDWFTSPSLDGGGKHIFGTVDVYVRGTNYAQQIERKAFVWDNNSTTYRVPASYASLSIDSLSRYSLKINDTLAWPIRGIVEIVLVRGTGEQIILGTNFTKIDNNDNLLFLEGTEPCYKITGDSVTEQYTQFKLLESDLYNATNISILNALSSEITSGSTKIKGLFRLNSPLTHVPTYQPVSSVYSVVGDDTKTGAISTGSIRLIKSQDPLLEGYSNRATDTIRVDADTTVAKVSDALYFTEPEGTIELVSDMVVNYTRTGAFNKSSLNSVRSEDMLSLYEFGTDYILVPLGRYGKFGIKRTATSRIPFDTLTSRSTNILVGYNQYSLKESCTYVTETLALTGSSQTALSNAGFVKNVWLPESYGNTTIANDADLTTALVPRQNRYIKIVKADGTVMIEGRDYKLTMSGVSNQAYLAKITTGRIIDGESLTVSYFYTEVFTVTTGYPGHVEQAAYTMEQSRHAAADVLVKDMIENGVDVTLAVELNSNTTPEIMDGRIRTAIGMVLSNARDRVTQAEIIRQVKSIPGVSNVIIPLTKFAKSDGAMNIGHVIPSGTDWELVGTDPLLKPVSSNFPVRTYISVDSLLEDSTIPSGGLTDSFVGLLYEGQSFYRASSLKDFIAKVEEFDKTGANEGAFYIIGVDDSYDSVNLFPENYCGRIVIRTPSFIKTPTYASYKVTYEVWREGGQKDITLSPTEYLKAGRITIDYL